MDTPAWMQAVELRLEQAAEAVERRLEQAAEDARSRPAKAGIQETGMRGRMDDKFIGGRVRFVVTVVVIPAPRE